MNINMEEPFFENKAIIKSQKLSLENFIFDKKIRILFNKLFTELCKKSVYTDVWKSDIFPDIPSSFKKLVEEKFWLKENIIFEILKNNFFKSPYTLKTKLKNSIKAFVKDFQWQKIKNNPNMSGGTKNFLISQKQKFIASIENEFSKNENMKPKIIDFVKQAIIKKLKSETKKVKIEELKSVIQKLNELKRDKTNIWLSEFFNIKDALKNIFSLQNNPLSIDTFEINSTTFDEKMNKWISERLQYQKDDVYENKTFWIYKQDLIDLLLESRSSYNNFHHKDIISLKLAKQIFGEKLELNKNDLDEEYWKKIIQVFPKLAQGFIDFGLNFSDIKIIGELYYEEKDKERGEIEISIFWKNKKVFLLKQKIKFVKEISLEERIKDAWNKKISEMSKYFKKHIDERDFKKNIENLTFTQIQDLEKDNLKIEYFELNWNQLKKLLLEKHHPDINEINYDQNIKTTQDIKKNIKNIIFKYKIKINRERNVEILFQVSKINYKNNKISKLKNINKINVSKNLNIKYKSLIYKIYDEFYKSFIPKKIISKIWINQLLNKNGILSDIVIDQNKAFDRINFDALLKQTKIFELIKTFNEYRTKKFGDIHKNDFQFKRFYKVDLKNKKTFIDVNFIDIGMKKKYKNRVISFDLSYFHSSKKIKSGFYKNKNLSQYIKDYFKSLVNINEFILKNENFEDIFNTNDDKNNIRLQNYIPKIGEKLDLNLFKVILKSTKYFMNVSEKMKISFRTIIDEIKNLGFENVKVSKVYFNDQKQKKGVNIILETSYYVLNSNTKEKVKHDIFYPIGFYSINKEYIENKRNKTLKFINENWSSNEKKIFKGKEWKKEDFIKLVNLRYEIFLRYSKNYKIDVSRQDFDKYTNDFLIALNFIINSNENIKKLNKLYDKKIPKKVLDMIKDKKTLSIISKILKLKTWKNNNNLWSKKIKKIIENEKLINIFKKSPNNIQKVFANSLKIINKVDKKSKYVYFGAGIMFTTLSAILSTISINKFRISKKSKKLNINIKTSKSIIISSTIMAILTIIGSITMNIIFFIFKNGF